jgi:hypothetical protein
MDERPKMLTTEMRLSAAKSVVIDLVRQEHIEEKDAEQSIKDIAKHAYSHIDGYELAKKLDSYCGWDCNLEIAEALDGFSSYARSEIETAEKAWAERVNPMPPLPIGARVRLPHGETGMIDEVYEYGTAKFCVAIDGDPKAAPPTLSRRIVNFEDVTEIT